MPLQKRTAYRRVTFLLAAISVVVSLSLSGCSLGSLIPNHQNPFDDTPIIHPEEPDKNTSPEDDGGTENTEKNDQQASPSYQNPLTGLMVPTDVSTVRPVALSYGNSGKAPIQYGIGYADILIEAPIENGETRLIGITTAYPALTEIGGIAASRPYLLSFADAFSAVCVCDGYTPNSAQSPPALPYALIDCQKQGLSTVFYRASAFSAPFDLFTSGTRLMGALEGYEKKEATLPFSFVSGEDELSLNGGGASGIVIPFSTLQTTQFTYDQTRGVYLRKQNSAPHVDTETGETLSYKNLLILVMESTTYNKATGSELSLDTDSGGRGFLITNGTKQEILWSRAEDKSLSFTDVAGNPLTLNHGKTYIGMVDIRVSDSVLIIG